MNASPVVREVTGLYPVPVFAIATPTSITEIIEALARTRGPVSVGGGHFSMGGQTASPGSLHLDLRRMNRVLDFSPERRTIRVQAGTRWCDIQRFIDPHGFAVSIMQTYANFTVGGALSVNCHGRYVGMGPVILSVRALTLVLADGSVVQASREARPELFFGAIGGYGGIGIIAEVELDLAENRRVQRVAKKLATADYLDWFRKNVRSSREAIFHNADLYAPHFRRVRAVTWSETLKPATRPTRLMPIRRAYPMQAYLLWAVSEGYAGKWRREFLFDPLIYASSPVHWRNYEAGYDVRELEPPSRKARTYVLQEYFVPLERFDEFVPKLSEILTRHRVNALNISVRHALADHGSLLAWAREECFAFVLYHKQRTRENARARVAVWTRELIEAVLSVGGTWYLPYQPHATPEQFQRGYPRAQEFFDLKQRVDPHYRLRNSLWDRYYAPQRAPDSVAAAAVVSPAESEFHTVYGDDRLRDGFYRFLQNVYHLYPEDRFHALIQEGCRLYRDDEAIYRFLQDRLPGIAPKLGALTHALPALAKQKREMARQTLELLGERRTVDGYLEIGSTGRYIGILRKSLRLSGDLVLVSDVAPSNAPPDLIERGQIAKLGRFVPMRDYAPIEEKDIASGSLDLVTCYIGLHHIAPERLQGFADSIARVLRPGGRFILRDHEVTTPQQKIFVSLVHTVFNAGIAVPWETNQREPRHFDTLAHWSATLARAGLHDGGRRLYQAHDPSDNALLCFDKPA